MVPGLRTVIFFMANTSLRGVVPFRDVVGTGTP
jgi:hypothetical protein